MNRPILLLALGGVALAFAAGCSSLTKPDEIHVLDNGPPSVPAPAAAGEASPQRSAPQPGGLPAGAPQASRPGG